MKKRQTYHIQSSMQTATIEQSLNAAIRKHQQGNLSQAEQLYRQILQVQPKHAYVLNLMGVLASQKGNHQDGEKLIAKAIKIDSTIPDYHNNLGLALQQQGKLEEAALAYEMAIKLNPEFTNALISLGNISVFLKKPEVAIQFFRKVIEIDSNSLPAYNNLGNLYRNLLRFDDALEMFNKVLALKPDFAEGWYNIGVLYKVMGKGEDAITAFDKAIALKHNYLRAYNKRGKCRGQLLNDFEGALKDFNHVLEINPGYVPSYIHKASTFLQLGQFNEAETELRKALEIDESAFRAYLWLASSNTYSERDLAKLQLTLEEPDLNIKQLTLIHFSLGKIFNDRGEHEKAFRHFQRGNELHRSDYQYDPKETEEYISHLIESFDETFIRQNEQYGLDSELPVFIVGMPRSGTTLTEQIIGSHPEVHAAGELDYLFRSSWDHSSEQRDADDVLDWKVFLTPDVIKDMANEYLANIRKLNNTASRITDKMPYNFHFVGLISLLFTKARIIHCRRNPLDTCLSIYFEKFEGIHKYAYDLTELGLYYRQYLRLMQHWEKILPGRMFTVQYEDLIQDQEGMSRRLIVHAGLPWDERCLQFYETKRSIKTASQWQVRQKLYTTSRERWRNYEPWLGPLIDALGDALDNPYE